jgi:short-subunit dehydrogenase
MAPQADPKRHRASIKTPKLEITTVVADLENFDQVVEVCQELVQREGVKSLILCPGFSHEAVAKVASAVGKGVAITVARGDVPSTLMTREMLKKEGW